MMKEKPVLFSGPMIRAILEGKKTQTRRIVLPSQTKPRVPPLTMEPWIIDGMQEVDDDGLPCWVGTHPDYPTGDKWFSCPYGGVGWRLWARETFTRLWFSGEDDWQTFYRADDNLDCIREAAAGQWKPSIFMPRALSRIDLEVLSVRVERLHDISDADICAELGHPSEWPGPGAEPYQRDLRGAFAALWDAINGKRAPWSSNAWVWVVSFRRV